MHMKCIQQEASVTHPAYKYDTQLQISIIKADYTFNTNDKQINLASNCVLLLSLIRIRLNRLIIES